MNQPNGAEEQSVERVTVSLTRGVARHPKVRDLVRLKRFSFYVEGLIDADLRKNGIEVPPVAGSSTAEVGV